MIDASKFEFPEYDYNRDEHGSGDTLEYIRIPFRSWKMMPDRIQEKLTAICEGGRFLREGGTSVSAWPSNIS